MDDKAGALKARFFSDAGDFLARSSHLLTDLVAGRGGDDDVHELFRCIHSIKSEASYLKLRVISKESHALEEILELARTGAAGREDLIQARDLLTSLERSIRSAEAEETVVVRDPQPSFNMFELSLLDEAKKHGEQFFRIRCDLDPEAPMKQARAYLILSNLEQIAGVVRMEPPIQHQVDDAFGSVTVYLTAAADESEIYRALDIDQVVRSLVEVVGFPRPGSTQEESRVVGSSWLPEPPSFYRLGSRKLNQMTAYADELKITLRELDLDLAGAEDMDHRVRGRITRLSHLATGLFDELRETRTAELSEEFDRLSSIVEDLGGELEKPIAFSASGGDIKVDRRNLMALSDPLTHLVRNAADHGLEAVQQRLADGKPEDGHITVSGVDEGKHIRITVSDDGKGIDEDTIRDDLAEAGEDSSGDLIDIVSRPGFSTLESATGVSGRGVGLDLVVQRVESIGGEITLDTTKGRGTTFTILLPKGAMYSQLLFFRLGQELFALSNHTVTEVNAIGRGDLKKSASGKVFYKGIRAFSGGAIATVSGAASYGAFALIVSHLGKTACFLADDVLFEHDVKKELLDPDGNSTKKRLAVRFGSGKREFFYLSPSMIQSNLG